MNICSDFHLGRHFLSAQRNPTVHKFIEPIKADDFVHVHVIPKENETLLHRRYRYSGMGLEETWRNLIIDQSKYKWIEPKTIVQLIDESGRYAKLVQYLNLRYEYK